MYDIILPLLQVRLLGPWLVRTELPEGRKSSDKPDYFIKPVTLLPNIIELNYYASALAPLFAADAIIGKFKFNRYFDVNHFQYLNPPQTLSISERCPFSINNVFYNKIR